MCSLFRSARLDPPITMLVVANGAPAWKNRWKIVTIGECEEENFAAESEDTVLVGCLIAIKHYSTSNGGNSLRGIRAAPTAGSRGNAFQRLRYNAPTATYDRLLYFADINTPGRCFLMVSETVSQTDHLLKYAREKTSVGDIFVVQEPEEVTKRYNNMSIVVTDKELIPLQNPVHLPTVELRTPQVGMQRYFALHAQSLKLYKASMVDASCKGILCDRQNPLVRGQSCGCVHMARMNAIVVKLNVGFEFIDETGNKKNYQAQNFRSWRTTTLLVKPSAFSVDTVVFQQGENADALRSVVRNINRFINENGGWTVIGWYRRGEVADASGQETGEQVASMNQPIHLAYVYPTDPRTAKLVGRMRYDPTLPMPPSTPWSQSPSNSRSALAGSPLREMSDEESRRCSDLETSGNRSSGEENKNPNTNDGASSADGGSVGGADSDVSVSGGSEAMASEGEVSDDEMRQCAFAS